MNPSIQYCSRLICILLVGLYTTIYVGWDMVHARVHQEEAASHSAQIEKDSCHRSVFHGEQDVHKNHISTNTYCASCHVVVPIPVPVEAVAIVHTDFSIQKNYACPVERTGQVFNRYFSSRAPPALV